ncbi:MAG: hypothetical protein ABSD47_10190 [Candidatus Methylomirabilota bacterium]|jgi:hypothetical protein
MADAFSAWALGVHGVVFPLSLVGLYRYSDRTELFTKAVGDTDELLARMRRRIAAALERDLNPVFERSEGEPSTVRPDGYSERPTNPIGSEAYREALFRFIEGSAEIVVDYGRASRARGAWCAWARVLSWTVLGLAFWEVLCVSLLGLLGHLFGVETPTLLVKWSFVPTAALVCLFFVCQAILLRHHDVIHDNKSRYHTL